MPNHCENDLTIFGSDEDVASVLALIGADQQPPTFDFNAIVPYPDPYKAMDDEMEAIRDACTREADAAVGGTVERDDPEWELKGDIWTNTYIATSSALMEAYQAKWGTTKDGFNSGGYEWCVTNRGTKWNGYDVARRDYDGTVIVTFQSAWSPPLPVIKALAVRFPTVTLTLEFFEQGMGFAGGVTFPAEDDYYGDEPWQPGIATGEWETKEYRGSRGG